MTSFNVQNDLFEYYPHNINIILFLYKLINDFDCFVTEKGVTKFLKMKILCVTKCEMLFNI